MTTMNKKQLGKYFTQWAKSEGNFCPSKENQKRVRMMVEYLMEQGETIINGVQHLSLHAEPSQIRIGAGANRHMGVETIEVSLVPIQDEQVELWGGEFKERVCDAFGYKPLRLNQKEADSFNFMAHIQHLLEISRKLREFHPMLKNILDGHVVEVKKLDDVTDSLLRKIIAKPLSEILESEMR